MRARVVLELAVFLTVNGTPVAYAAVPPSVEPAILHEYRDRGMTEAEAPEVLKLAESGNANAQFVLGEAYMNGEGVPRDDERGLAWLTRAARNGLAERVEQLAEYCILAKSDPEHGMLAKKLYQIASDAGDAGASGMLGTLIIDDGDVAEGLALLRKGAEGGNSGSQLMLAEYLHELRRAA